MKFISRVILLLFIMFLSTPTLVTLIEKNCDVSLFYNFAEEEIHKDLKLKAECGHEYEFIFQNFPKSNNTNIVSENLSKHDKVLEEIFSPPPELV